MSNPFYILNSFNDDDDININPDDININPVNDNANMPPPFPRSPHIRSKRSKSINNKSIKKYFNPVPIQTPIFSCGYNWADVSKDDPLPPLNFNK